jgi:ribonuclease HI
MNPLPEVTLYTDGACSGNPGPGGWAAHLEWNGKIKEISGAEPLTTNNRMEMRAIIEGLSCLTRPCTVTVCTDSALIVNAFKDGWIDNWLKRGWIKSDKRPVENRDLWEAMLKAMEPHRVSFRKVKGHANDPINNRVDFLAVQASRSISPTE